MNNNTLAVVIGVIVLLALGIWLFGGQAPAETNTQVNINQETNTQSTTTSATATSTSGTATTTGVGVTGGVQVGQAVKEFTVTAANFSFAPATMTVNKGDRVKITFKNTQGTHDFKLDEFGVNSGILSVGQEKTIEFVASAAGSYEYYCSIGSHRQMGMKGTLIVR